MIEFRRGSLVGLIAAAGASGVTVVSPDAAGSGPIDGRLVLIASPVATPEPRLQVDPRRRTSWRY